MPADLGRGFRIETQAEIAAGHHGFTAPARHARQRIHAIEELEAATGLFCGDAEIEKTAAVHIGILEAVDVAGEQAIQAVNGWVAGADISIAPRQILLQSWRSNAGGGEFHPRHRASRLLAGTHRVQQAGPGVMGVAGKADKPLAHSQGALQDRLPLYPVAIPGIEVVGNLASFGEQGLFRWREIGEGGAGGEFLQGRSVFVEQSRITRIQ